MKRKLFTLFVLTVMVTGVAWSQAEFGIRAGVNFQNLNGEDEEGDKLKNDLKVGFHAGVEVDIPLVPDFYIQPGILFSVKGANNLAEVDDLNASLSYIEVPIHFVYKPTLGTGKLILGIGPYLAYGVGGKVSLDDEEEDIKFKNDVSLEDLEDGLFFLKPLDVGADIIFGYQFAFGFFAQAHAQLGLLNLEPKYEGETIDAITKNTGFGVSLGFKF